MQRSASSQYEPNNILDITSSLKEISEAAMSRGTHLYMNKTDCL